MAQNGTRPIVKAPVDYFRDWKLTPDGGFYNSVTKRKLSRQEWEVEMAYEHMDHPDALALAKVMAARAAAVRS